MRSSQIKKKNSQAAELRKNNGDDEPDDASVYDLKVRLHPSQKLYALLKDIFDYNPEDFDSKELTESEVKEVKMLTELLEQVKTEEEVRNKISVSRDPTKFTQRANTARAARREEKRRNVKAEGTADL